VWWASSVHHTERFLGRGRKCGGPAQVRTHPPGYDEVLQPSQMGRWTKRGNLKKDIPLPEAKSFWWVRAGLRPARTHQKHSLGTGRERRYPAEVRTRPLPRHYQILPVIKFNGTEPVGEKILKVPYRRELFCVRGGRATPAHHAHKTLSMHGARTSAPRQGADPSATGVRPNFARQREEVRF